MGYPKRKLDLDIYSKKENTERRVELNEKITKSDVYLPDGILHDDLDLGMLNFVKENFIVISNGEQIPILPKILTIQKWGEYTTNWQFTDKDNNIKIPFIGVIRKPDAQPGTNPVIQRTIPDRKRFFYNTVTTWDGNQTNREIYKIPQPVAIDISYEIVIVCNTIRDLNRFNKLILQKFTSRQAYTVIKGHYIPIVMEGVDDNTPLDNIDGRRFYLQTYKFTLLGFLIDPEEFTSSPSISRVLLMTDITGLKNKTECLSNSADINSTQFISDGVETSYLVDGNIGVLFEVSVNGVIKNKDTDFHHIAGTPRITFVTPPTEGQLIKVIYYRGKNSTIVDCDKNVLNFTEESFIFGEECFYYITLANIFKTIISVSVNGVILDNKVDYDLIPPKDLVLNFEPSESDVIKVKYIY